MAARKQPRSADHGTLLVNKLTVGDARTLLRYEGGPMTVASAVTRLVSIAVVAALTARALVVGQAGVWHLALPVFAEYVALLLALPILAAVLHDPELRQEAKRSGRLLAVALVGIVAWSVWSANRSGISWHEGIRSTAATFGNWIVSHEMHWPIGFAVVGLLTALPARVRVYRRHGPPFVPVGLGCAMRVVVLMFGCFLLPWIAAHPDRIRWVVWSVLVLAELGALWMHWDVQQRLRRIGKLDPEPAERPGEI